MYQNFQHIEKTSILKHYQQAFINLGYEVELLEEAPPESAQMILPLLMAGLPVDSKNRNRVLNLTFLPFEEGNDFNYMSMIQCFVAFSIPLYPNTQVLVERLLLRTNNHLPLGYFSISFKGNLCFRHIITSSKWDLPALETSEQFFLLIQHIIDTYTPLIEAVSEGNLSLEEALQKLQSN